MAPERRPFPKGGLGFSACRTLCKPGAQLWRFYLLLSQAHISQLTEPNVSHNSAIFVPPRVFQSTFCVSVDVCGPVFLPAAPPSCQEDRVDFSFAHYYLSCCTEQKVDPPGGADADETETPGRKTEVTDPLSLMEAANLRLQLEEQNR